MHEQWTHSKEHVLDSKHKAYNDDTAPPHTVGKLIYIKYRDIFPILYKGMFKAMNIVNVLVIFSNPPTQHIPNMFYRRKVGGFRRPV